MRLIDADELKKKFKERSYWTYTHEYGDAIPIGWIMSGIDNTPTVDERPQGEWIDHSEDYGYAECPFCHELTTCEGNIDELHFCWKCGAKLEKGGAE